MTEGIPEGKIKVEKLDIKDEWEEDETRYKEYISTQEGVLVKIETDQTINDFEELQDLQITKKELDEIESSYKEYISAEKEAPVKVETNLEINEIALNNFKCKNEELNIIEVLEKSNTSTDTADNSTDVPLSPPKKRFKKVHFDVNTKEIILNIYKCELEEHPALVKDEIAVRVANKVGVSRASVYNVIREYSKTHTFAPPMTKKNRKSTVQLIDEPENNAIRRKVHQFFFRNELPTTDKLLEEVNGDPHLPNFRRSTFSKLLKKLKFKFQGRGRNSLLLERDKIVLWRRNYLRTIKSYRNEGRKIFYTGETFINSEYNESSKIFSTKTGKGKRLTIGHIGSQDGFLPDGLWTFESKKKGGLYEEMDGQPFENWFKNILAKLEPNSVIVLDNAPCHSRKLEKIPTTSFKISDIQHWLRSKNIEFDDSMLRVELLALVKQNKKKFNEYIIDEMAKSQNKIVLRLPPFHCELNPLELIWADVKKDLAQKNTNFKFAGIRNIFLEAVSHITADKWKKCVDHVQEKVETRIWELDNIIEAHVEFVDINVGNSSSSSSDSDSE